MQYTTIGKIDSHLSSPLCARVLMSQLTRCLVGLVVAVSIFRTALGSPRPLAICASMRPSLLLAIRSSAIRGDKPNFGFVSVWKNTMETVPLHFYFTSPPRSWTVQCACLMDVFISSVQYIERGGPNWGQTGKTRTLWSPRCHQVACFGCSYLNVGCRPVRVLSYAR